MRAEDFCLTGRKKTGAKTPASKVIHGSVELPAVTVDKVNLKIRDGDGFLGDRANSSAFIDILDDARKRMRKHGADPLGKRKTQKIKRRELDRMPLKGGVATAGLIFTAVEEYAQQLALVTRRFLKDENWRGTQRIAVGGGMRDSRVGEWAIGRAAALLKMDGISVDLIPIDKDPDEAGLIGSAYLWPPEALAGHEAMLAVDIGGSNIRAGILRMSRKREPYPKKIKVSRMELWRHADDPKISRDDLIAKLIRMLRRLIDHAEDAGLDLAPFIGVGCPGTIEPNGRISDGAQNLPGSWESNSFNLPERLAAEIPEIQGRTTEVRIHNDAVVQGLSQLPRMRDVKHWAVLTIGTGLGNAHFTNRKV